MKKFTIISKKGVTTLQDVEVEFITALEDPSVLWLKSGEYKVRVIKPESLYEKELDGSLTPPVWYWHAFYSCELTAREQAEKDIRHEMERTARKSGTEFNVIECLARCKEIKVVYL